LHRDHGEIDARDWRDREQKIGNHSRQKQARRKQRSAGWTVNERRRNVHLKTAI
jgi:hypothetical protein